MVGGSVRVETSWQVRALGTQRLDHVTVFWFSTTFNYLIYVERYNQGYDKFGFRHLNQVVRHHNSPMQLRAWLVCGWNRLGSPPLVLLTVSLE